MSDDSITVSQHLTGPLQLWGSLEILQEIGRGGFGVVYRAWEPALAREVALKIIRPREPRAEALAGILREGQLLARVRHPSVVTVYGAQQIGDEVGLWMEFVRGRSLSDLVKTDGPRAAGEAAVIGISLCQATAAVHQAGVLHRDIKAHNVMREAGGRIVLMDFGAGQLLEGVRAPDERAIGTPAYMAPEVLAGGRATARSDIYSLGILLYYLVTGTYPVEGNSWSDLLLAHARFERRPLGDARPDIPASFVRVVERATAINPAERYASPGAMLADLNLAATGKLATHVRRSGRTDSRRRKAVRPQKGRRRWMVAAAAALPLALGIIASVPFNQTMGRPAEYADESVFRLWLWGVRALIPGAVEATVVVLLWSLLAAIWRLAVRISPPVQRVSEALRARGHVLTARLGLNEPETATQMLLAAQVLAVSVFCWHFRDLFGAFVSSIDWATPGDIEPLRPEHLARQQLYNFTMAILILLMSVGTYKVVRMRRAAEAPTTPPIALVFGVIGVALVILVFPYRLMWHNAFEVVTYHDGRCYILGEQSASALLYCPEDELPRVKEIALPDTALKRSGRNQNIYTRVETR